MGEILWQPGVDSVATANLTRFMHLATERTGRLFTDYASLHHWSVQEPAQFWRMVWDFTGIIGEPGTVTLADKDRRKMPGARWFPDAQLNFAGNLLRQRGDATALEFRSEDRLQQRWSYDELYSRVARLTRALADSGFHKGDVAAAFVANAPDTLVAMLAVTALGGIWSSCSPDFGVRGVLDRFGQIKPKILFAVDGYFYNGKWHDCVNKVTAIAAALPTLEKVIFLPLKTGGKTSSRTTAAVCLEDLIGDLAASAIDFVATPFNHPLYILFSSGTTGVPKCIVHSVGGTLLQHVKEHQLHVGLRPGEKLFYFTTCGWMMWNWLVSSLASGASLLLYDGSPFYPDGNVLFDYAEQSGMNIFGTSAKYLDALQKSAYHPAQTHDLNTLRTLLSTGSPLVPEAFDYVYREIKKELCLSSISGGTDLISCFALGSDILPVRKGELQCLGLGMDVKVFDEQGQSLPTGTKGDLVCCRPFPSMPIGFWNDPDHSKYHAAYFEKYPGIWCHGDYVTITEHGGMMIYGRSDAVLNPGGVRIGTAEIYRQAERMEEIVESLVVGQRWQGDVRVVLFVRLRENLQLDDDLQARIRATIRSNTTPRHVPAIILQVTDIPRTKSGKIVELAVRNIIHDEPVKNREALANPEVLEQFRNRKELRS